MYTLYTSMEEYFRFDFCQENKCQSVQMKSKNLF